MGSSGSKERALYAVGSDVYHIFVHTGFKFPQANVVKKWQDSAIRITINPGADEQSDESQEVVGTHSFVINDSYPVDTQGTVERDFWVEKEKKVGEPKILKIEVIGSSFKDNPLYIREVAVLWNEATYRFPIQNYLEPPPPLFGSDVNRKRYAPFIIARSGNGTLKHKETENFILKARELDHEFLRSVVKWAWEVATDEVQPGTMNHMLVETYEDLPRCLQFRNSADEAFYGSRKSLADKMLFPMAKSLMISLLFPSSEPKMDRLDFNDFKSFEHYKKDFAQLGEYVGWKKIDVRDGEKVGEIFQEDHEFGRQIIQGPNSVKLRRVNEISSTWKEAIDEGMIPYHAIDGEDLQSVIDDGRLYEIINSTTLDGVKHGGAKSKSIVGQKET